MKILNRLLLKSFVAPFVATFCISIFVLLMQFLWVYIDDLVGKGLSYYVLFKFLFFVCITLFPLALPLSMLLSSLMTFGNLAENYELVAMKSAGLSLHKIMRPLTITSIVISLMAFVFSNNVLPWANLKMQSMLFDITHSKPALRIKEGIFSNGMSGYSIRVSKKTPDGNGLKDVMIYDHKTVMGNCKVVYADSGRMQMIENKRILILTLYNGASYEEKLNTAEEMRTRPLLRNQFKQEIIRFDLSDLKMNKTDEALFKTNYQMLTLSQLKAALDSMHKKNLQKSNETAFQLSSNHYSKARLYLDRATHTTTTKVDSSTHYFIQLPAVQKARILQSAILLARNANAFIEATGKDHENDELMMRKYEVERHKKFTLSIACAILFFIGAPLGAIIKKGGLGMPVVISVVFFILFYILSVTGEKLVKEGTLEPAIGMWIAPLTLLPIGILLTRKATADI